MAGDYPKRPKYFAHKFVRKMAKVCLANDIGPEACWMLAVIVHTEDAKHYRGPVTFSNGQLMPLVGLFSVPSLARAREKAVKAGWLYYQPGMKGRAGTYWVTVPARAEGIDDLPTDDSGDDFASDLGDVCGDEAQPKAEGNRSATVAQPSGNRKATVQPSSLEPDPNPDPNSFCSKPGIPASEPPPAIPSSPTFLVFPVVGGKKNGLTEWALTEAKVAEYRESYPGVDIEAECRRALQWCRDNPKRQKTFVGMPSFLSAWLAREQNRPRSSGGLFDHANGIKPVGGNVGSISRVGTSQASLDAVNAKTIRLGGPACSPGEVGQAPPAEGPAHAGGNP